MNPTAESFQHTRGLDPFASFLRVFRKSAASCFVPWLGSCSLKIGKFTVGRWKKCLEIDKQCKFPLRSASSASFPRDRQVVHDRRWPVAAELRSLIHLAAAVIGVFRSHVGVAADRCLPSHRRTCINAKPPMKFAKFLKIQNQYTKLLERFCKFW